MPSHSLSSLAKFHCHVTYNVTQNLCTMDEDTKICTVHSIPGMSEKSKIHSLKPNFNSWPRSCRRMATPMHSGNDELPSSSMSHRWNILCSGNTSVNKTIH